MVGTEKFDNVGGTEYGNAFDPMVTPDGMVMEVKLDAPWNALAPMLVNLEPSANVTEVKTFAFWNA